MKNGFYCMLKALFVFEIFTFLPWHFGYVKNGLTRKLWLILKIMTSQTGPQIITIHMLPNISRSKDNQAKKFGLWKNVTWEIFFLKNHTQKVVGNLVPDPSIKIKIEHVSGSTVWNVLKFVFMSKPSTKILADLYQNALKLRRWPLAFTLCKTYLENKRSGTSLPISFSALFFKKNVSHAIFY